MRIYTFEVTEDNRYEGKVRHLYSSYEIAEPDDVVVGQNRRDEGLKRFGAVELINVLGEIGMTNIETAVILEQLDKHKKVSFTTKVKTKLIEVL